MFFAQVWLNNNYLEEASELACLQGAIGIQTVMVYVLSIQGSFSLKSGVLNPTVRTLVVLSCKSRWALM